MISKEIRGKEFDSSKVHVDELTLCYYIGSILDDNITVHTDIKYKDNGNLKEFADIVIEDAKNICIIQMKHTMLTKVELGSEVTDTGITRENEKIFNLKQTNTVKNYIKNTYQNIVKGLKQLYESDRVYNDSNIIIKDINKGKKVIGLVLFSEGTTNNGNGFMAYGVEMLDLIYNFNKLDNKYYIMYVYSLLRILNTIVDKQLGINTLYSFINDAKINGYYMDEISFNWYINNKPKNVTTYYDIFGRCINIEGGIITLLGNSADISRCITGARTFVNENIVVDINTIGDPGVLGEGLEDIRYPKWKEVITDLIITEIFKNSV